MERKETYVGIDVAKAGMDIAVRPTDESWAISNDEAGIRRLVSRLKTLEPDLVLLEASGGLELPIVAALAVEELPVVVVNPRQVRDFARATGKLAKTDTLDAAVLAHFGEAVRPPVRPLRDAESQAAQLTGRSQTPVGDDTGRGEESPEHRQHCRRTPQHRGPHRLVGAGAERPGREPTTAH